MAGRQVSSATRATSAISFADEKGVAKMEWLDPMMQMTGPASILGRSVIVHTNEDDLKSQPTGNAGGREGCGVIGIAK